MHEHTETCNEPLERAYCDHQGLSLTNPLRKGSVRRELVLFCGPLWMVNFGRRYAHVSLPYQPMGATGTGLDWRNNGVKKQKKDEAHASFKSNSSMVSGFRTNFFWGEGAHFFMGCNFRVGGTECGAYLSMNQFWSASFGGKYIYTGWLSVPDTGRACEATIGGVASGRPGPARGDRHRSLSSAPKNDKHAHTTVPVRISINSKK